MRAACAEVVVRDAPATPPSSSALPLTADFFHQLAQANLTAVGYRVLFWHMDRLIRHRMTSETVPLETTAQALGLHRNAVGKAYAALTAAGLVRRQEVRQRGAPTRTCAEGAALQAILQAAGKRPQPTRPTNDRHAHVPTGTRHVSQLGQQRPDAAPPIAVEATTPACPPTTTGEAGVPATQVRPVTTLSVEQQGQALAKLPPMARYDAMQGKLTAAAIDTAWSLSAEERSYVLGMRQREASPRAKASPSIAPVPTKAPNAIAVSLLQHRAQFAGLVDAGALSQLGQAEQEAIAEATTLVDGLLDQVAYMIAKRGLGRGNVLAGVRAARSLVAQGRWTVPWDFTKDWYGAVERGAGVAHS